MSMPPPIAAVLRAQRALAVAFACFAAATAFGTPIAETGIVFSADFPGNFDKAPANANGRILRAFVSRTNALDRQPIGLYVEQTTLSATAAAGTNLALWQAQMPSGTEVLSVRPEEWRSMNLDVVSARYNEGDTSMILRTVDIPSKPDAIRLSVRGHATQAEQIDGVLKDVLASLDENGNLPSTTGAAAADRALWLKTSLYLLLAILVALVFTRTMKS